MPERIVESALKRDERGAAARAFDRRERREQHWTRRFLRRPLFFHIRRERPDIFNLYELMGEVAHAIRLATAEAFACWAAPAERE